MAVRNMLGDKVPNSQVVSYYKENIKLHRSSEAITQSFIEAVGAITENMIKKPCCLKLLRESIDKWGSLGPFESAYKLQAIVRRCERNTAAIEWCIKSIMDLCLSGQSEPGEISEQRLKEGIGCHKGLIDLQVHRMMLRDHILSCDITLRITSPGMATKVRVCLKDHDAFRAHIEPLPKENPKDEPDVVDTTWKTGLKGSEKKTIDLYEARIFIIGGSLTSRVFWFALLSGVSISPYSYLLTTY
jgi:hypothetical protein